MSCVLIVAKGVLLDLVADVIRHRHDREWSGRPQCSGLSWLASCKRRASSPWHDQRGNGRA